MSSTTVNTENSSRIFDGFRKVTGRKTTLTAFRVYKEQYDFLKSKYEGNTSVVIRFILDKLLNGDMPDVDEHLAQLKSEAKN